LQAKPESFEILIAYLTATSDFEKSTFLDAMLEYLKGDTSNFAITFRQLLALIKENLKPFSKVKKETYFFISKGNSSPILSSKEDFLAFFDPLKIINSFGSTIIEFLKELFVKKDLFEKYIKFDNNVRTIWPNIYKRF
jgi:hypothetical protein